VSDYSLPTRFDPLIHQSSRLAIIAVLAGAESVDFAYLLDATGLTKGTLSKHLSKLRDAGYISVEKGFKGSFPHTTVRLTPTGKRTFKAYRSQYIAFSRTLGSV
jgi:DNA-binding MarR family transcriptional regulator